MLVELVIPADPLRASGTPGRLTSPRQDLVGPPSLTSIACSHSPNQEGDGGAGVEGGESDAEARRSRRKQRSLGRAGGAESASCGCRRGSSDPSQAAPGEPGTDRVARGAPARYQGPTCPGDLAEREADLHVATGKGAARHLARGGREAHA